MVRNEIPIPKSNLNEVLKPDLNFSTMNRNTNFVENLRNMHNQENNDNPHDTRHHPVTKPNLSKHLRLAQGSLGEQAPLILSDRYLSPRNLLNPDTPLV